MGCSSSKATRTDENVDPNKATEAEARQWFANYDKDGKNGVNINDLKKFHAESYEDDPARGEREAEKFLKAYDTNQDGTITLEEYLTVLRKIGIIN